MVRRYGVVEIGTRGVRLLVADASRDGIEQFVYSTGDLSDLGRYADRRGNLSPRSIQRVCRIVSRYIGIAEGKGARQIIGIATEGVRAAPNRDTLIKTLAPLMNVWLLSREEEAAFSFVACVDAFADRLAAGDVLLAIDQGGGSTELTAGSISAAGDMVLQDVATLNLGSVTIAREFVSAATPVEGLRAVRQIVRRELAQQPPFQSLARQRPRLTVGLGSSITRFMWDLLREGPQRAASLQEVHRRPISAAQMARHLNRIEAMLNRYSKDDLGADQYIDSELAVWLSGFVTYYEILNYFNVPEIFVSRNGTRYGAMLWHAGKQCRIELM
ncbi:MAG: Ppx/GppA phosphatase family protein [Anaerolineae bacterium]